MSTVDESLAPASRALVHGLPDPDYRAWPWLSHSDAKMMLPPSTPALYHWQREHGRPDKRVFDEGHAAHQLVLGAGQPIARLDFEDRRTKIYKEAEAEARAKGEIPLLAEQHDMVLAMAEAIRAHPITSVLFTPGRGHAEVSLSWHDERHEVTRKARIDWLILDGPRPLVVDYKSSVSADPRRFAKSVADFGYHTQDDWYRSGVSALTESDDTAMVFVVQERTAPYLISVVELDGEARAVARAKNDAAIGVFKDCTAREEWPGYSDHIESVSLPAWADRAYL